MSKVGRPKSVTEEEKRMNWNEYMRSYRKKHRQDRQRLIKNEQIKLERALKEKYKNEILGGNENE